MLIIIISYILMPKLPEFYKEKEWDILFFGTSETYCAFDPEIFDEYGFKTYNRGKPKQTLYYTYYYMKDAFEVSNVKVAVLETHGLMDEICAGQEMYDMYEDSTLNDMRFSITKLETIVKCSPKKNWIKHFFYLDAFHGRWEEIADGTISINAENLLLPKSVKENRGYHPFDNVKPRESYPLKEERFSNDLFDGINYENIIWLEKIIDLCNENEVKLILVKSPWPCYKDEIEANNNAKLLADERNIPFINYMQLFEEVGLDYTTDCTDDDGHPNRNGSIKLSNHLASYIKENILLKK